MKSLSSKIVLVAVCVTTLTGCGVSQSKHKKAVKELEKINSILAEQQKNLQEIQNEENTIAEKKSKIRKLKYLEDSTFDSAEAYFNAHNYTNAFTAYNTFIRDFSESDKVELAQKKIQQIRQFYAHEKWVADAPIRAAQAKAAAIAAQAAAVAEAQQARDVARARAVGQAQEEGRLQAQEAAQFRANNNYGIGTATISTARGTGASKGDAYAAARQRLLAGAEELHIGYGGPYGGSYTCKITYRTK